MTLSINLTLVVQMVHFIIAYLMINYLFLKPGYKVVAADLYRVKQITSRIVARQELIAHKRAYKQTRWKLFRDYFYKQKPQFHKDYETEFPHVHEKLPELTVQEREQLVSDVSAALRKKVLS